MEIKQYLDKTNYPLWIKIRNNWIAFGEDNDDECDNSSLSCDVNRKENWEFFKSQMIKFLAMVDVEMQNREDENQ